MSSDEATLIGLRSRYIDLLMKSVLGMVYGDGPEYNHQKRMEGLDWPTNAHSMIGWKRLTNIRELVEAVIEEGIPGDLIETGVWRGGACIFMRGLLAAYGITDRRVYLADSFRGLPTPDVEKYPADAPLSLHTYDYLAVSSDKVRQNFEVYGLLDRQVLFIEGWFKDTLQNLKDTPFALIRLDGDYYESTIQALTALYPLLSPGGYVIIDDYGGFEACAQAVEDYRRQHGILAPLQIIDTSGRWWRKPKPV